MITATTSIDALRAIAEADQEFLTEPCENGHLFCTIEAGGICFDHATSLVEEFDRKKVTVDVYCNWVDIDFANESDIDSMTAPGDCSDAVEAWISKNSEALVELRESRYLCRELVGEYTETEGETDEDVFRLLIWIAAGNAKEGGSTVGSLSL